MSNSRKSIETIAESVNLTVEDIDNIKKNRNNSKINWKLLVTFEACVIFVSAVLQGYLSKKTFIENTSHIADIYPYAVLFFGSTISSIKSSKNGKLLLKLTLFIIITTLFSLIGYFIGFQLNEINWITKIVTPKINSSTRYGVYNNDNKR